MDEETDNASDAKIVFVIWVILLHISIIFGGIIILSWEYVVVLIMVVISLFIMMIMMTV